MQKQQKVKSLISSSPTSQLKQIDSDILPQKISTEVESCLYVKKMIALAISNVTYLRGLFNSDCYVDRLFDDLPIKVLRNDNGKYDALRNLKNWITGAYEAIEKKYLKSMVLGIFADPEKPNDLLESYHFNVSYEGNEANLMLNVSEAKSVVLKAKLNSHRMLRVLSIVSTTLEDLPDDVYLTMKLYYYEDVTPPDYEPPYFQAAKQSTFSYQGNKGILEFGRLNSKWHRMMFELSISDTLIKSSELDEFDFIPNKTKNKKTKENEAELLNKSANNNDKYDMNGLKEALNEKAENKKDKITEKEDFDIDLESNSHDEIFNDKNSEDNDCNPKSVDSQTSHKSNKKNEEEKNEGLNKSLKSLNDSKLSNGKKQASLSKEENIVKEIDCPCKMIDQANVLIQCESCKTWQHAICFKFFDEAKSDDTKHYCHKCNDSPKNKGGFLDKSFLNLNETESRDLCLVRRCLYDFIKTNQINKAEIFKKYSTEDANHATWLLKRLISEGFLKCVNTKKQDYCIQNVDDALKVYFQTDQYKITDTQTQNDQTVPIEPDDNEANSKVEDKNETIRLRLRNVNQSNFSNVDDKLSSRTTSKRKQKCSEIVTNDGSAKKKTKSSDVDKTTKIKKPTRK